MGDCNAVSAACPVTDSFYGYAPSLAPNIALLAVFGVALVGHIGEGIYYRSWGMMIAFVCGCLSDILGYVGRILMHPNPFALNPFLLQICCLSVAPAFFSAAIYLTLSRAITLFGTSCARLKPRQYTYIFITCDIISLCLQASGGAFASTAAQGTSSPAIGDNIMISGLSFQVFSLVVFAILTLEYIWRASRDTDTFVRGQEIFRENKMLKAFFIALGISYTCILVRCTYRIIELSKGWSSALMRKEDDFVVLEGVMIAVAVLIMNVLYPGAFLTRVRRPVTEKGGESSEKTPPENGAEDAIF